MGISTVIKSLMEYEGEIDGIFNILVKDLIELLPDFGTRLAVAERL